MKIYGTLHCVVCNGKNGRYYITYWNEKTRLISIVYIKDIVEKADWFTFTGNFIVTEKGRLILLKKQAEILLES